MLKRISRKEMLKEFRSFYLRERSLAKLLDPKTREKHLKILKSMIDLSLKVRGFKVK